MGNKSLMLITLLVVASCLSFVNATTYKSLTIEELLEGTEIAFQGKVTAVEVELLENPAGIEEPWTKVSFDVLESFKGELGETHSLFFYGGISDALTIEVEAMPTFRVDEELLLFAYNADYYSPLLGFSQGLFRLDEQGWQSEADMWLSIEDEKFVLSEAIFEDSEAVIALLNETFASVVTSSEVNAEVNAEAGIEVDIESSTDEASEGQ